MKQQHVYLILVAIEVFGLVAVDAEVKQGEPNGSLQGTHVISKDEFDAQREGLARWARIAEESTKVPNEQMIEKLAEGIRKTSRPNIYSIEGTADVAAKLRNALIPIPGHAKCFENKIEALREEVLATAKLSNEERTKLQNEGKELPHISDYEDYCSWKAFPTLGNLPSPETVAVLGRYLNEPTGRDGKTLLGQPRVTPGSDDISYAPCNAEMAAAAISQLGIENPPYTNPHPGMLMRKIPDEQVDAWKDWWNEVKAGKRTYRFIGSNIEYGPDGPVNKEQLKGDPKRSEELTDGRDKPTKEIATENSSDTRTSFKILTIALVFGVVAVIASIVWYFRKSRER